MSNVYKKVGGQALIYMIGVVVNRMTGFIMLPIYTSYLTTGDYGVLELLTLTVEVIGIIMMAGLSSGVFKFHAEYDAPNDKDEVLSTAAFGVIALSLGVGVVGMFASPFLTEVVLGEGGRTLYFRLFFIIYLLQQWEIVPMLLLRIQDRAWTYVGIGFARLLAMLSLNIWLVVYRDMGILGVIITNVVTTSVVATLLLVYLFRTSGTHFSRQKFGKMVRYGTPMILWFLGGFVLVFSDRYFLRAFAGLAAVGIYSLGYRFVMVLPALVYSPFQAVWEPERFRLAKLGEDDPTAHDAFRRVFTYLNLAMASAALGLCMFTREVLVIMADPAFHSAYRVVPTLLAAQVVYHWTPYANIGLLIRDRTDVLGRIAIGSSAVMVLANLALVPLLGMMGAALATLVAYVVRFLMVLWSAQSRFRIDYDWGRVLRIYGIVAMAVGAKAAIPYPSILVGIAAGSTIFISAAGMLYLFVLTPAERALGTELLLKAKTQGLELIQSARTTLR